MLPASYSTVADVLIRYPPIGSVTAVTSLHIASAIGAEQARIDGMLGVRYQTPFQPTPPVIEMICGDLATLRIVGSRVLLTMREKNPKEWTAAWEHSFLLLQEIAKGKIDIVSGSGTTVPQLSSAVGEIWSNTRVTTPTFIGQDWPDVDDRYVRYWPPIG